MVCTCPEGSVLVGSVFQSLSASLTFFYVKQFLYVGKHEKMARAAGKHGLGAFGEWM
jgi:hypothetical protein